jgi:predicted Zn-dependent protease
MIRAAAKLIALALVAGAVFYVYRTESVTLARQVYRYVAPCTRPIPYTIGTIDPRFGITTAAVLKEVRSAERAWEEASEKDLFVYSSSSDALIISLVYDTRQETTNTLKKLGLTVDEDVSAYNAAKERYGSVYDEYLRLKSSFESAYATYQHQSTVYEREVHMWNARGGASQKDFTRLEKEKQSLNAQEAVLQEMQREVNAAVENVNALVTLLNHLVSVLNIATSKYNSVGAGQESEFQEAVYESSLGQETITVYEFDDTARLRRVFEHELGHALGLGHVEDAKAIMYRLNQGTNEVPTKADMIELALACRL